MRHPHLPAKFTRIGVGEDGREYIQCTRTGDVLVQTDEQTWTHYASTREWRARVGARLYPELIHLQRTLKEVGNHEEVEEQIRVFRRALAITDELAESIRARLARFEERARG